MPSTSFEWLDRVKSVEREHNAISVAVAHARKVIHRDPTAFVTDIRLRDLEAAASRLEATYIIRVFAEFETCLRSYWASIKTTEPRVADLIDAIAARRKIPTDRIDEAHLARRYRNVLVHERDEPMDPIALPTVRRFLCRYTSFLPLAW